jgi:hypothetical protein
MRSAALEGQAAMRKIYVVFTAGGISVFLLISGILSLEYNRVQKLCRSSNLRVESAREAINAIRNYRVESGLVGTILSRVRESETFQSDGYSIITQNENGHWYNKGGGWHVEEWTKPFISRGYSVDFEYFDRELRPAVEIKCDALECGAIDIPNRLTLGSYYAQ